MVGLGRVDFDAIITIIFYIGIVTLISSVAQWILAVCNNRITFCVSKDLRNAAIRKIQQLPLSYLDAHPAGDLVSRIIADVDVFADGLLMGFTQLFSGVLMILGTLGIMFYLNIAVTLVVVILTPLSLFTASFIAKRAYRYFQEQTVVRGQETALIHELVGGQKVVQAFGHEAESLEEFDRINNQLGEVSLKAVFFSSLTNPSTRLVNNIVYAAVGLVSALYAVSGGITVGQLSVFLSYASQYAKPFNEISGVVTELQNALACAARIFELLDEPDQTPEAENALAFVSSGHVQLKDVAFRYVPDKPLIEHFSLDVTPGQRIAIVGPTGCGKTTLINLLMRFYDVDSGSIEIDETDIRNMTRHSLRGNYGMVLQDTWLKAGTIRDNIAYARPGCDGRGDYRGSKGCACAQFYSPASTGIRYVYYGKWWEYQPGAKTAFMHSPCNARLPPMLILDEATSSIDTRTENTDSGGFCPFDGGTDKFYCGAQAFYNSGSRRNSGYERRPYHRAGKS